jgi:N-acetylglucosaminyl-diphospho-decaprenol L-rhamnosyltransferase
MPGVVVVTYNSAEVIEACIDACRRLTVDSIVVVDNASVDGTASRVSQIADVELIANPTNRGFGAAVNQGIAALETDAVLILNPDAIPIRGLDALEKSALSEGVGAASGRLIGLDGHNQQGFNIRAFPTAWTLVFESFGLNRLWPGNPVNRRYRQPTPSTEENVDQPAGAFLMVRRSAWQELRGFDESFFPIWFEDVDFCKRLKDSGYKIRYTPEAIAQHQGGHSATQLPWKERQVFWYGSLLRYASKHLSIASRRAVGLAVILACFPRMLAGMFQFGVSKSVSMYVRVVWLAGRCLR